MILDRLIPSLLALAIAAAGQDDTRFPAAGPKLPKVVCLSESCRDLIPAARQIAADEGYPVAVLVFERYSHVLADGFDWWEWDFELHVRTFWPDALIIYVVRTTDEEFEDDEP